MRPRYRKISTAVWGDQKFSRLSDSGKLVFLFGLTHPHLTALGAMRATLPGLAAELKWSTRRFTRAIREAIDLGMVDVDDRVGVMWWPNFLNHNEPEGPNSVVKAWPRALEEVPECPLKRRIAGRALAYLQTRSEAFRKELPPDVLKYFEKEAEAGCHGGMPSGMPSPMPSSRPSDIQEQEPKPEQEPDRGAGRGERRGDRGEPSPRTGGLAVDPPKPPDSSGFARPSPRGPERIGDLLKTGKAPPSPPPADPEERRQRLRGFLSTLGGPPTAMTVDHLVRSGYERELVQEEVRQMNGGGA